MNSRLPLVLSLALVASTGFAAPDYHQNVLQSIFPAGAGRGQTVDVLFTGTNGGLEGAEAIIVDGRPGITVHDVKPAGNNQIQATLAIAPDAEPGRRMLRVKGGITGLTNFRWFFVGTADEFFEKEQNNTPETAEPVITPVVINGRVDPTVDQDCFRFEASRGQKIVAAVMSHRLDALGYDRQSAGFADTSLELLDDQGRVLAEAGDTLGFDPLIHHTIQRDGSYTVRVSGMGYSGFPQMVYRLTLGEVPYPTAIFPVAGRRGETVDVEFFGPNVPPGTTQRIEIPLDDPFPVQQVSLDGLHDLPLLRQDIAQQSAPPTARGRESAFRVEVPSGLNGRFEQAGQQDWCEVQLAKDQMIALEVTAQRHLRAPVDTLIEVLNAAGEVVAQNDDGTIFQGECTHDFVPFDSYLEFAAKESGPHWIRVSEQSGSTGERAVYHLTLRPAEPDFRIFQWPDAVPIWGPGTTAAFVVETHRVGGMKGDIELVVVGLPDGWVASTATAYARDYKPPRGAFGQKTFLTITSPDDVPVGTMVEFHVVGRAELDAGVVERTAQALTQYMWQEPNHFRFSPLARAVVAKPTGIRLTASVERITATPDSTVDIPLRVDHNLEAGGQLSFSVNRASTHFQCSMGPPVKVPADRAEISVPLNVPANFPLGTHTILVADGWSSETRKGLPGPCTQLITLEVQAKPTAP